MFRITCCFFCIFFVCLFFFFFFFLGGGGGGGVYVLMLNDPVKSYGRVRMVNSPNHTFVLGKLDLVVNQYSVHLLSLLTDNNPS